MLMFVSIFSEDPMGAIGSTLLSGRVRVLNHPLGSDHASPPSIGYSVTYPFGVIGPILCFYFLTRRVKPHFPPKPARFHMGEVDDRAASTGDSVDAQDHGMHEPDGIHRMENDAPSGTDVLRGDHIVVAGVGIGDAAAAG